ncbi:hypothetical protein TNCT_583881 [Trichonephila clavata]|uniref:Uncharacterized protein n=1 Tax=Trichonephila clavata TaxID=2740835 RepID=A0A8X6G3J0_TRICU|nr:hypothetical protein TNCT_583881 [Trichonephila clavata]
MLVGDPNIEARLISVARGQLLRQDHAMCRGIYCIFIEQNIDKFLEHRYAIKFCEKLVAQLDSVLTNSVRIPGCDSEPKAAKTHQALL